MARAAECNKVYQRYLFAPEEKVDISFDNGCLPGRHVCGPDPRTIALEHLDDWYADLLSVLACAKPIVR